MLARDLTAVILCGGKGERLQPLTSTLPKALVPIAGRPLLLHLLSHLSSHGVTRFVLCVGHQATFVKQFVADNMRPEWDIRCIDSGNVSMSDRILDASAEVEGPMLICYGDTLAQVDLEALLKAHRESGTLATVTVHPLRSPFGIVEFDGNARVRRIVEKPLLPYWVNIGFVCCQPEALHSMQRQSSLVDFCATLAAKDQLAAYTHRGEHITVNTPSDLAEAELFLADRPPLEAV